MKYPTIETKRLILRKWKIADADDLVEGLNNYNVAKQLTIPFPYTKKDALEFISKAIESDNNQHKEWQLAVELKSNKKIIGGTAVPVGKSNVGEGGIWLNENYHGKGYGTEIWRARAEYCFNVLKCRCLVNGFFEDNEASWKMQKKIGYKLRGDKVESNCPARGCKVTEVKTILKKEDFVEE